MLRFINQLTSLQFYLRHSLTCRKHKLPSTIKEIEAYRKMHCDCGLDQQLKQTTDILIEALQKLD